MRADLKLLIYCSLVLLPLTTSAAAAGDVPPVAAFAGLPQVQQIALSPDGRSPAYIQNRRGASYLVTQFSGANAPKTTWNCRWATTPCRARKIASLPSLPWKAS